MADQQPPQQPQREREIIVTNGGGGGGPAGVIVAIIGIAVVLLLAWFLITNIGGTDGGVELPSEVDINVENPAGGEGGDGGG